MDIEADDVSVVIDGRQIVGGASLVCRSGALTALVGPSGCGKTTFLHCLGLLLVPSGGRVLADGADTTGWGAGRRRRFWKDHGAFVLQDYGVLEEESVAFNVTMTASLFRSRPAGDHDRVEALLDHVGLGGREEEPASHLSGGEKQRLGIARAMYKDAQVIYVDEPTASLDESNRARVIELFTLLAREGRAVVAATHDGDLIDACDAQFSLGGAPLGGEALSLPTAHRQVS